jgi:uncharacterized membrane protein
MDFGPKGPGPHNSSVSISSSTAAPELTAGQTDFAMPVEVVPLSRPAVSRVVSVDLLRGAVMILMAVDHAHFFFCDANAVPEFLPGSSVPLFFTRWITHFCAPAFFLLAGTGAFLSLANGSKSREEVTQFLWTRGLWLITASFTVIGFAWTSLFPFVHGGVMEALGVSMILMVFVVRLPVRWIAALGVGIMVTHNLLDRVTPLAFGRFAVVWSMLHVPGAYPVGSHRYYFTLFTIIPWFGVMAAGYAFGSVLLRPDRRKIALLLGATLTVAFLVLRGWNLYGNSASDLGGAFPSYRYSGGPWSMQASLGMTIVSFLNTLKYPASLQFLLMTLGPIFLALGWLDRANRTHPVARILLVYGRVPFLFYVLHLLILHTMAVYVAVLFHQPAAWLLYGGPLLIRIPPGYGHGLPFIYAMWVAVIVLLYLPCKGLMKLKEQHPDWLWLRYL